MDCTHQRFPESLAVNVNTSVETLNAALEGRYHIEREIGAGGMATVFLAKDLRHERDVAIKVLHPDLGAALGAERFLAEIKTTAKLQHPHILPLLDSGNANGLLFYVMPLIKGETLRARLEREGQLSIDEARQIAMEVADALYYAHNQGVIHRDIKPENILLQGGHALVADFGIALAVQSAAGARMTQTGLSLGTPQYMSPEQAMGERKIDSRSDVYALGAVLYEMLAGDPPFTGSSVQAIVAKVLTEKPASLSTVRDTVPPQMEAAVLKALSKLPADRYATAAAFISALNAPPQYVPGSGRQFSYSGPHVRKRKWTAIPVLLCVALAAFGWWKFGRKINEADSARTSATSRTFISFPAGEAPVGREAAYAMFPDGQAFVYVGGTAADAQVFIKRRSELHASPISGTAGAANVFVSPDGAWIGFVARGQVFKVPVAGGTPVLVDNAPCTDTVCDINEGGAFLDDGRVVHDVRDALVISGANGAAPDTLVSSRKVGGLRSEQPNALPGSRGVLFTACTLYCNRADVWVVDSAKNAKQLILSASHPVYVSTGHILYRDAKGSVFAQRFSLDSLTVSGTPVQVLDHVNGALAIARDGTVLYADGDPATRSELVFVARDGKQETIDSTWRANFASVALSLDGKRIAATIVNGTGEEQLWVKTVGGDPPVRLTFDKGQHTAPTWSADGRTVMYNKFLADTNWLVQRAADGTGAETILQHGSNWVIESTVSRDGVWRLQREYHRTDGTRDIFARQLTGDTVLRAVVATPASDFSPTLSPDSKWMAYSSEEGGTIGIWAVPFPISGGVRREISSGGWEPTWSADGREIFFVTQQDSLVAVSVSGAASLTVGKQRALFSLSPFRRFQTHRAYDVRPGGGFIMIRDGTPRSVDLVLVDNWFAELRTKLK